MAKFVISMKQINYMDIEVDAKDFDEAKSIYDEIPYNDYSADDFVCVSSDLSLWSIESEDGVKEVYY
jgi:hypothetical protein